MKPDVNVNIEQVYFGIVLGRGYIQVEGIISSLMCLLSLQQRNAEMFIQVFQMPQTKSRTGNESGLVSSNTAVTIQTHLREECVARCIEEANDSPRRATIKEEQTDTQVGLDREPPTPKRRTDDCIYNDIEVKSELFEPEAANPSGNQFPGAVNHGAPAHDSLGGPARLIIFKPAGADVASPSGHLVSVGRIGNTSSRQK
ncbi:uncharacterized protein RAG0_16411 [Rhynchosporium agropyri]|uniref:Uncharacterized protein n=1 Tax=Rhynchosporium agropyri TaxID=914238 RepID=A0A1E1LS19_9HELO|nr:uncharacterized protein RAG0_16411 [Rhynchosporium agropyri]